MAEMTNDYVTDQKRLKENLAVIQKLSRLLKITTVMAIIAVLSVFFAETDLFAYILVIGLLGAGIASYCCATTAGHGMVDIEELGAGCGALLYYPIYSVMYFYFILSGWVYGLVKRSALRNENAQIIAKHGKSISQPVSQPEE